MMTDEELKSILRSEIASATSAANSEDELSERLEQALKYYLGDKFGNELQDRSQVVLTVTRDTIDWMMTQLMGVFEGSDDVVTFDPTNSRDVEQAELETNVVNHVFEKENNGFLIMYTWIKDALMQKNGIIKTYYSEEEVVEKEKMVNLTDYEISVIFDHPECEIKEHTERIDEDTLERLHDVTVVRTKKEGGVIVENVPPEEFGITDEANNVFPDNAPFCYHKTTKTRSQLKQEGFDPDIVDSIGSGNDESYADEAVEIARDNLNTGSTNYDQDSTLDKSRYQVDVYECYLDVDFDGDGISEKRKVTYAGNEILLNEEIDEVPFSVLCPNILPHKFYGLSVADDTMDLQLVESIIMRNVLDNLYAANNQKTVVNQNVNLDDLLTSRPDGVIRTAGSPAADVMRLQTPNIIDQGLSMIDYLDTIKEQRTGIGKTFQGQNQGISGDTAHGVERIMSAAEKKVDLISRIFAETGVRDVFLKIRKELHKHGQMSNFFIGEKDVEVDPTTWKDRKSATVKVGLGTGDKQNMQIAMARVLQNHERIAAQGGAGTMISAENMYRAYIDEGKIGGLASVEKYYTNPKDINPQPKEQPPDPTILAIQASKEIEAMKAQNNLQLEQMKEQSSAREAEAQRNYEAQLNKAQMESKEAIEAMKEEVKLFIEGTKVDLGPKGMGTLPNS